MVLAVANALRHSVKLNVFPNIYILSAVTENPHNKPLERNVVHT